MRRVVLGAFFFAIPLLAGCMANTPPAGMEGGPAPDFTAVTLEGDSLSLSELRGHAVLVNFWATWCPPCRRETPELQALYEEYADDGLRILGVSVDASGADDLVREFTEEYGVTYTILRDPDEQVSGAYQVRGVPTSLLVGPDGTVLWRHMGQVTGEDPRLRAALEEALPGRPTT